MGFSMSEKPETDEFEDEEAGEVAGDEESLDVDRLMQDLDKRKRGATRAAEPAWRKLERLMEQKRTSELLSDFDDYDIGDERGPTTQALMKVARWRGHLAEPARQVCQPMGNHVHDLALQLQLAGHAHQP